MIGCVVLVLVAMGAPARADGDRNCNGIARSAEGDCVDYFENGSTCAASEFNPSRACDDYLAPGHGLAASCGPELAGDRDGDLWGDACDNCPAIANADQKDSVGNGVGDACRCLGVTCTPLDACHLVGVCEPSSGACTSAAALDATTCSLEHANGSCAAGVCTLLACVSGFGDCNHVGADGCEMPLNSVSHCGACSAGCAEHERCETGVCVAIACAMDPSCDPVWRGVTGCAVAPGRRPPGPPLVVLLLLAALWQLRRGGRARCRALVVVLAIATPATSYAQHPPLDLDLDHFHPAPGTNRLLVLDTAEVVPRLQLSAAVFVHYVDGLLEVVVPGGPTAAVVKDRVTADAAIAVAFLGRYEVGVALPVALYQHGDDPSGYGYAPASMRGLGDLRLSGKARIVGNRIAGVAAALDVYVPTGDRESYLSSGRVTGAARLIGSIHAGPVRLAGLIGWRFAPTETTPLGIHDGNSLLAGVGLAGRVYGSAWHHVSVDLTAEVIGQFHYSVLSRSVSVADLVDMPLELVTSAQLHLVDRVSVYLGVGAGLDRGYGEPHLRLIAGVSFTWPREHVPHEEYETGEPAAGVVYLGGPTIEDLARAEAPEPQAAAAAPAHISTNVQMDGASPVLASARARAEQWLGDVLQAIDGARAALAHGKAARRRAQRQLSEALNALVEFDAGPSLQRSTYIGENPASSGADGKLKKAPHLSPAEVPGQLAAYDFELAELEAKRDELIADPPWDGTKRQRVEAYIEAYRTARHQLLNAAVAATIAGADGVTWYESPHGIYIGWLPVVAALPLGIVEACTGWEKLSLLAEQYSILTRDRGAHPALAVAQLGLLTAGEFVGITQLIEAGRGKESLTDRDLDAKTRGLRVVVGTVALASVIAGFPRVDKWGSSLGRGARVRWFQPIGPSPPQFVLVADGAAAPLVVTGTDAAALARRGVLGNAPLMRVGDPASVPPPAPASGPPSLSPDAAAAVATFRSEQLAAGRSAAEVEQLLEFFEHPCPTCAPVPQRFWKQTMEGFKPGARVEVLTSDLPVVRYYSDKARSFWVTERRWADPVRALALPKNNRADKIVGWIIPRGTKVLRGVCSAINGQPGGATQIFVPDFNVLRFP